MAGSRLLIPALLALLAAAPLAAVAQAPRDPIVLAGVTEQVSPHVYVIPDQRTPLVPNVGIIVGKTAALVVDTGLGERNGRTVLAEAQKVAPGRQLYLVTTHVHPEHDLGAQAFPDSTKLIRSNDEAKDIAEFGLTTAKTFAARSAINAELLKGAEYRKGDILFDQEHRLDLGGVRVRILAMGPNHTRGDTAIWVVDDRVLFAGDIVMKGQPAFASPYSNLGHWIGSLGRLEGLKPKLIVPSHGPMGGDKMIGAYRKYLTRIRDKTAALKRKRHSADEAVQTVTAEMQRDYPDTGRLEGAIRAAFKEAPAPPRPKGQPASPTPAAPAAKPAPAAAQPKDPASNSSTSTSIVR